MSLREAESKNMAGALERANRRAGHQSLRALLDGFAERHVGAARVRHVTMILTLRATDSRARLMRIGGSVAIAIAAILLRLWWLEPLFGRGNPYLQNHLAVLLAAWTGGVVGGVLAILTSAVGVPYAIVAPQYSFRLDSSSDQAALALFVGIGTLITLVCAALQRAQRNALRSEERYRSLVELSPDAMCVNAGGKIVYANASTMRLLGASDPAQILGRSPLEFIAAPSQDLARRRIEQLNAGTRRVPPVEQEWLRLDGRTLPVEVTAAWVPWGSGEAIQVIFRDVSERRRADQEREALLRQAQEASRLKEEFLAVLSHELRTPLTAVLGWAHLINSGTVPGDRVAHGLGVIERNARAQVQIVDELLAMSEIVMGRLHLTLHRMDLRDLARSAVETVRPAAAAKAIALDLQLPSDAVCVQGDPLRVQQIIWHLLTNAVKFTDRGGAVHAAVVCVGVDAELTVSDSGMGISPEFLPHVFERFRQQEGALTRSIRGLGLGLSLVRSLVEAHGGEVHAWSPGVGGGSTFVVRLPLAGATRLAEAETENDPQRLAPAEGSPDAVVVVSTAPPTGEHAVGGDLAAADAERDRRPVQRP